jgi:hypothetical protein
MSFERQERERAQHYCLEKPRQGTKTHSRNAHTRKSLIETPFELVADDLVGRTGIEAIEAKTRDCVIHGFS